MKRSYLIAAIIFFLAGFLHGTAFAKNTKTTRALNTAAEQGDLAKVKSILKKGKVDLNAQDGTGMTALMSAALSGNLELVKFLLEKKVALESKNNGGETALAFAVTNDNFEVAQELIRVGANVDVTVAGEEGDSLFARAASSDRKTAELILSKDKTLVNKTNKLGETALFAAARYGTIDDIDFLIKKGADTKIKNSKGQTALEAAKEAGNQAAAQRLSGKGP